ncbi:MAG: PAS domain-containing sensor histidine kinase [Elusimicrobia bacterium]|nr:PAS domain-containing sensor histidine kinase [Elusimicrobiota bacterium]
MDLFGRASWVMFAAGAVPTGLAGWWLGTHAGRQLSWTAAFLVLAALAASLAAAYFAWRWFAAPLRELERGLERWTRGDLSTPLDEGRLAGWKRLGRQFAKAQEDIRHALNEANVGLAQERSRLETLVERIPDALVITNLRGEVQFLNAMALQLFGAKREDALPGKGLLQPRDPTQWRLRVQDVLKAHTSGGILELPGPSGAPPSSFGTTVTMFTDPVTGDFGVLMLLRDQTAERRLDAMKEEFFQAAAHDLRAPLFAIQGYLHLLKKSIDPDGRQKSWLEAIDQSCERLTTLIRDALDSARMDSGHLKLMPAPIEPRALMRRAAHLFQPMADERRVTLETRLAEGAPETFIADERLVERLVHNLVANAIKFTPQDGRVTIEAAAAGQDRLELVVTDTGPGVPEAQRAAIFEKFRQLDTGNIKTGFGLGLAICAKIVKLHKGEIWVQSAATGGAQFVVRLPLVQVVKEAVTE